MNKNTIFVILAIASLLTIGYSAYAETNDTKLPIMSHSQREQIFEKSPSFQGTSNINYYFEIIITPTGFQEKNVVLNSLNYSALKNNVAFFTACGGFNNGLCEPPVVTTAQPTTNYCPLAQMILLNQGDYISKLYNVTKGVDLTNYVYPAYCYAETGPNPINGQGIPAVPEFPTGLLFLGAIFSVVILLVRLVDGHWVGQFGKLK